MHGSEDGLLYTLALSLAGVRVQRLFLTRRLDDSPAGIYASLPSEWRQTMSHIAPVYGNDPAAAAEKILQASERIGCSLLCIGGPGYPDLLSRIDDPPLVLYVSGVLPVNRCVAVVGTRSADQESYKTARHLSRRLAKHGLCIVSGMAVGIDRAAHEGAMDAHGPTIGVLGGGVDTVYPRVNSDIYLEMMKRENAALLSEFPPAVSVMKWSFVKRNRIISGLSEGVVVVKAAEKSGALITADFALEQNREVFACCHMPYNESYAGCIRIVNEGAWCVASERTVLDVLNIESSSAAPGAHAAAENPDNAVLRCIMRGITNIDDICRDLGISSGRLNQQLTELELEEKISRYGGRIRLRRPL
ncbi:MAG: DNA-processing protein DprA [Spirochaetota bacterium]